MSKPLHLLGLAALLAAMVFANLTYATEGNRAEIWAWTLLLLLAFAVLAGHAVTGYWRGILVDARNKISLSRLQLLSWSLVILSALFTAALTNVSLFASDEPLAIDIDPTLWVLMGISTASLVGAPVVLGEKRNKSAAPRAQINAKEELGKQGYEYAYIPTDSLIVENSSPAGARWADIFKGEEIGNAATIDFGKLQMFFFTFILVLSYGAAIASSFAAAGPTLGLPVVDPGMNTLLGISHTGYLTNKAVPHTREES